MYTTAAEDWLDYTVCPAREANQLKLLLSPSLFPSPSLSPFFSFIISFTLSHLLSFSISRPLSVSLSPFLFHASTSAPLSIKSKFSKIRIQLYNILCPLSLTAPSPINYKDRQQVVKVGARWDIQREDSSPLRSYVLLSGKRERAESLHRGALQDCRKYVRVCMRVGKRLHCQKVAL